MSAELGDAVGLILGAIVLLFGIIIYTEKDPE